MLESVIKENRDIGFKLEPIGEVEEKLETLGKKTVKKDRKFKQK